jgi:hypothetical protein
MKHQKGRAVSFTESLPSVVEKLIAAVNAQDTEGFVAAFTPDAVIDDWGARPSVTTRSVPGTNASSSVRTCGSTLPASNALARRSC